MTRTPDRGPARRLSTEEIAGRAGVDPGFVEHLRDRGVLEPASDGYTEGDARRARIFEGLERAGVPLDAMIESLERGELTFDFLDLPLYDRFSRLSGRTFRDVSEQEGIPFELLVTVREAVGFAQPDPDDVIREDELRVVPIVKLQLSRGFDPAVIEQWLRVYGETLRRVTETEADWWRTQITSPGLESGETPAEVLERTNRWGEEFATLTEQALLAIYHGRQEHAWTASLIEEIEASLDRAGLVSRTTTPPAICFLDITGYTRLTEERGDAAAAAMTERLAPLVRRPADRHGGTIVKWLGDGVMFHFRDPLGAVRATLEMIDAVASGGLPPAHVGIHVGPVVFQGGDYFGRTVNVAARIADLAEPGQLLVSQEVVDAIGPGAIVFEEVGPVPLKGVSDDVRLFSAGRT